MSQKYQKKLQRQQKKKKQQQKQRDKAAARRMDTICGGQEDMVNYRKMTECLKFMRYALVNPDTARAMGFTWPDDIGPCATKGYAEVVQEMEAFQDAVARAFGYM